MEITAQELARKIGGEVVGDGSYLIRSIAPIESAGPNEVAYTTDSKRLGREGDITAGALICPRDVEGLDCVLIRMDEPKTGFALAMQHFHPRKHANMGVHPNAWVSPTAEIGEGANVYPGAYVGNRARVGARTDIMPGCFVGDDAVVGEEVLLHANVTVYHECVVGDRVIIHSGTVIGSDGYGFATTGKGEHVKIPQVGNVVIEDDVEIGAQCAIDRAIFGSTTIGKGAKLDNLVQIAHNVQIGPGCLIVAQVGIAGSSSVGHHCILAGQVGIVGHIKIGDQVIVGAQAGVSNDLPGGQTYLGSPARPMTEAKKLMVMQARLPQMRKDIKELKKKLAD
jgi:UDP-3-O-[3-hydroxymyristoyl] glucosamine N-acyltransferase